MSLEGLGGRSLPIHVSPPFPHDLNQETLKYIYIHVKVTQSCVTPGNPMDYTVHGILQARILEWVAFSTGSSQPRSPELQEKPKNTGVGSLSLLQQIFLTQESNQDLLHCKWILYQLSYQASSYKSTKSLHGEVRGS